MDTETIIQTVHIISLGTICSSSNTEADRIDDYKKYKGNRPSNLSMLILRLNFFVCSGYFLYEMWNVAIYISLPLYTLGYILGCGLKPKFSSSKILIWSSLIYPPTISHIALPLLLK